MDTIGNWIGGNIVGIYFLFFLMLLLYVLFVAMPEKVESRLSALKGHRTTITGFFLMTVLLVKQLSLSDELFDSTFEDYTYFYLVIAAYIAAGRITKLTEVIGKNGIQRSNQNTSDYFSDFEAPEQEYYYNDKTEQE